MSQQTEEDAGKLAIRLANAAFLPMALKSALELNLPDIISAAGDGALLSPSEISAQLLTKNPDAPALLDRLLCLLASYSILKCSLRTHNDGEVERLYGVEPVCKFLTMNQDGGSVGPLLLLHHDKWILHDWSDEHCLKLLKNCWEALPKFGKVIVVESILPLTPENSVSSNIGFEQDLIMLLSHRGGKERTQKEFEALAIKSGFAGCEVICSAYNSWVMEFNK